MNGKISIWSIEKDKPSSILPIEFEDEMELENWIVANPDIIQSNLKIIGKQVKISHGVPDLIAIDPHDRLVVIENKKGNVNSETLTQALLYAKDISNMTTEQFRNFIQDCQKRLKDYTNEDLDEDVEARLNTIVENYFEGDIDIKIYLVGETVEYRFQLVLDKYQEKFDLSEIAVQPFQDFVGKKFLSRNISDLDIFPTKIDGSSPPEDRLKHIIGKAKEKGVDEVFKMAISLADKYNFGLRSWTNSIMFSPENHKGKCMFTIWLYKPKQSKIYIEKSVFVDYYGFEEEKIIEILGNNFEYQYWYNSSMIEFLTKIEELFSKSTSAS